MRVRLLFLIRNWVGMRSRGVDNLGAILRITGMVAMVFFSVLLWACSDDDRRHKVDQVVIYPAMKVITINTAKPFVEAIATRGDRILALGSVADLERQFSPDDYVTDTRFEDKVIMPGFVEPHLHPSLAAIVLQLNIVAAMEWPTPSGTSVAVTDHSGFLARMRELNQSVEDEWLLVWGYHAPYHGEMSREILDSVSSTRPIMVWQRSIHEMYFNTRAMEILDFTAEQFATSEHANWEEGHLWESGLLSLGRPMIKRLAGPMSYLSGMSLMSDIIHRGGITTVAEQGFPQIDETLEFWALWWEMDRDTPYRFALVPNGMFLLHKYGDVVAAEARASKILTRGNAHILPRKHMKYYADGAIFSQLMLLSEPYLDGHIGAWMMPPEQQKELLSQFWQKGWDIHIHVNGDAGLDNVLADVEALQGKFPDKKPRVVLEHYGYARTDQHQRVKSLNIAVSNNAYYVSELAPIYAKYGLGPERASDISPLGGLAKEGVPISFHSDYPMAPAEPLTLVWSAVNRIASDGAVWGEDQKLSLDLALRAITLEAAWSIGLENEIGSIAVGKKADFTILDQDPYDISPQKLKDIPIWGTVFEGRHFPLKQN
jgi:predicted amidohydrolase YtcJ